MKRNRTRHLVAIIAFGLVMPCALPAAESTNQPPSAPSAEKPKEAPPEKPTPPVPPIPTVRAKIVFKLPLRGAPAVRIDGGSRGSGVSLICLNVLTTDTTALTVQEQPSLFWYQSEPADVPCEVALLVRNTPQPLLRVQFPNARKAGIQRLNLADHNVRLAAGAEYEWVVALVVDPDSRSKDVVARGAIQRVEASPMLKSHLAGATGEEVPMLYAADGIWLDALTTLSDLIEGRQNDRSLQDDRASLLSQVGLTNAAAYAASRSGNN